MICTFLLVEEDIDHLVLTERIETIVPLTYIAVMAAAYFGPNAEILASVKLKIWHQQSTIDDFNAFAMNVGMLLGVDFASFVINGLVIWELCKINILKVLWKIQKQYWFVMILTEATLICKVRYSNFQFAFITNLHLLCF